MVAHDFISDDQDKRLIYNLVFSQKTRQIITLPTPSLFNIHSGTYLIMPADINAYWERTRSPQPEPEPSPDQYQESIISGILRSSLTSGTPRIHLSTLERINLIHGHRPTKAKSLSLGEYVFLIDITFMLTHSCQLSVLILFHCIIHASLFSF